MSMVLADEIGWTPFVDDDTVVRFEDVDLLTLSDDELFTHCRSLRANAFRETLHEAVTMLHRANAERDRYEARLGNLLGELRQARHEVRALSSQLRTMQEHVA